QLLRLRAHVRSGNNPEAFRAEHFFTPLSGSAVRRSRVLGEFASRGHRLMSNRPRRQDTQTLPPPAPPPTEGASVPAFFLRTNLLPPPPAPALLPRPLLT